MDSGLIVNGWDDLENYIESIEITEAMEVKALTKAGQWFYDVVKEYIERNVELTGYTRKMTKGRLSRANGDKSYKVTLEGKDILYIEYGSQKNMNHVGFFDRLTEEKQGELLDKMAEVIEEVLDI